MKYIRNSIMEDNKLFQIGDVAKMFHISVGSLRHYEKAGLLKPEYTDSETGYRYYSIRQFEVLNTIRYLRVLDMPLNEIGEFLKNRDINIIEEKLLRQKEMVAAKLQELETIERKIDHRLQHLRDAQNAELNVIHLKKIPSYRIVWIQDSLRPKSYLDLEYAIRRLEENQPQSLVFLGKVGVGISKENLRFGYFEQYNLVFLILDEEDTYHGEVEQHSEEFCVSVCFRGSHNEADVYYRKLIDYIDNHEMQITGASREITMIDNGITGDPDKFVTEIYIPVKYEETDHIL